MLMLASLPSGVGDSESGTGTGNGRSFSTNSAHCTQVLFSTVML
jgi:hypothetical protein